MPRPQNGLNPGARPMPAAPSQPIRPGLNPQHMTARPTPAPPASRGGLVAPYNAPPAAVAGGGERFPPYTAPPQPGNIVGGYASRSTAPAAVAGQGEAPRMNIGLPVGQNTSI